MAPRIANLRPGVARRERKIRRTERNLASVSIRKTSSTGKGNTVLARASAIEAKAPATACRRPGPGQRAVHAADGLSPRRKRAAARNRRAAPRGTTEGQLPPAVVAPPRRRTAPGSCAGRQYPAAVGHRRSLEVARLARAVTRSWPSSRSTPADAADRSGAECHRVPRGQAASTSRLPEASSSRISVSPDHAAGERSPRFVRPINRPRASAGRSGIYGRGMDDKEIMAHIDELIETEHELRQQLAAGELTATGGAGAAAVRRGGAGPVLGPAAAAAGPPRVRREPGRGDGAAGHRGRGLPAVGTSQPQA